MDMYAVERRRWIVDRARTAGRIDVAEAARHLEVAPETVRRDLNSLQTEGLLRRVHGGAVPVERQGFEGRLALRSGTRLGVKARIAEAALGLLSGAELIYLDEGSTVQALADRLHPDRPLTVVTPSIPAAMVLSAREHLDVIMLGGRVRPTTLATVEHWALAALENFVFDLAIMGTNGLTVARGLTCPDPAVAAVKSRAVHSSRRVIALADGAKFGIDSSYRFAALRELDAVVTDRSAGEAALRSLRSTGQTAVVA